ncbi:MAG: tail fiber domain-containing protein [Ferruginibacter sp.]|nr:tail fiber domain-containing protein [Cytophagales bacterium]
MKTNSLLLAALAGLLTSHWACAQNYNADSLSGPGGSGNTHVGHSFTGGLAGFDNTVGSFNSFTGYQAGIGNATGSYNTTLGAHTRFGANNLTNAAAIGSSAQVNASNSLVLGQINGVNGSSADTKVGIRTPAPAYHLHVNGTVAKPGGGSWTVAADKRLKQEITDYKEGLATINQIRPVWFRYNGKATLPTDQKYVGVVAQEMQRIAPHTVGKFVYQDSTGKQEEYLDFDANALTYMLVNAVREQQGQLQAKDAQLATLQQQILTLQNQVSRIEQSFKPGPGAESTSAAKLWQNQPNPYGKSTIIRYYLPENTTSAQLKIFSVTGQEVHSQELTQQGPGETEISTQILTAGTYVYHLVVNGTSVASRKMVLSR